jgi:hypothetical protein
MNSDAIADLLLGAFGRLARPLDLPRTARTHLSPQNSMRQSRGATPWFQRTVMNNVG